ncbi:unnamed protein product [Leptosia nina]|uniref:RNase H type-1 domain-containing protein n=1 Tax=Leptosia nina TaxID=320188 RepID=A0AAV1J5D5_9NEOP
MNNVQLVFVNSFKYLGVIIDNKFKFTQHSAYIIEKAKKLFYKLLLYTRPTWGVHSDNIRTIYEQVIIPIISYATNIWSNSLKYKFITKKFLSLQRLFAIKIVHGFRTLSTVTSISLAQLIPLPDKIKSIATIESSKLLGLSPFLPSDIPLEKFAPPSSLLHPSLRTPITFTEINSVEEFDSFAGKYMHHIFTDGSKHDGAVGAAFVVYDPCKIHVTKKFKLHPSCSVYQAEMLAIQKACEWITSKAQKARSYVICSDSKSSLQELSNPYSYNSFAVNIFKLIHTIGLSNISVGFAWVRAHIGIAGNETADIAAKSAAVLHKPPDLICAPISHIKLQLRSLTSSAPEQCCRGW